MLGSLGKRIISVLRKEKKATAREIFEALIADGPTVTYVSVNTVLSRLYKKGLVKRTEEPYRGRIRYEYEYIEVKDQWIADFLSDVDLLFGEEGIDHLKDMLGEREQTSTREEAPLDDDFQYLYGPEPLPEETIVLSQDSTFDEFLSEIEELSGQNVMACYQCGKCSAGCPMVSLMDQLPSEVIRLVQLGQVQDVLDSKTIWLCASCFSCTARCPKGVDLARVMEALRQLLLRRGIDNISTNELEIEKNIPQMALVSNFRKKIG